MNGPGNHLAQPGHDSLVAKLAAVPLRRNEMNRRPFQLLIALDQFFNVLIGSGYADETISAFAQRRGGWRRDCINAIFFWQDDHCFASYLSETERRQLPPMYRETISGVK